MSYNITTFKVKELTDLRIPVKALYKNSRDDYHPSKEFDENGVGTFSTFEGCYIKGSVIDGIIHVEEFDCCGEGSGSTMMEVFRPALKESTGVLVASCIWEVGDSIERLEVRNGKVQWVDIEI